MNHTFNTAHTHLIIQVDPEEQEQLQAQEDILSDASMYDFLEPLICNSDLEWIDPKETGDITDAPILGIRDEENNVLGRWGWTYYQVISLLEELRDQGRAVLVGWDL